MELAYALLAANTSIKNGKMFALKGDVDSDEPGATSGGVPPLSVVVKLTTTSHDMDRPHEVRIEVSDPSGRRTLSPASQSLTVSPVSDSEGAAGSSLFVAAVPGDFDMAGEYKIHIIVDSSLLAELPLQVLDAEQAEWDELEKETFSSSEFSMVAERLRSTGKASA